MRYINELANCGRRLKQDSAFTLFAQSGDFGSPFRSECRQFEYLLSPIVLKFEPPSYVRIVPRFMSMFCWRAAGVVSLVCNISRWILYVFLLVLWSTAEYSLFVMHIWISLGYPLRFLWIYDYIIDPEHSLRFNILPRRFMVCILFFREFTHYNKL